MLSRLKEKFLSYSLLMLLPNFEVAFDRLQTPEIKKNLLPRVVRRTGSIGTN